MEEITPMSGEFLQIEDYKIIQDHFSEEENKYYEGILAQGNGYFHVRGTFEEGLLDAPQDEIYVRSMKSVTTELQRHPLSKQGTFLPLIMGQHPFLEEVVVNLPYFMGITVYSGDEKLDMIHSQITGYSRILDMRTGELVRSFVWKTEKGEEIGLEFRRFASMERDRLFVQKMTIHVLKGSPDLRMVSGIDGSVTTNGYCHFVDSGYCEERDVLKCRVKTDLGEEAAVYSFGTARGLTNIETEKRDTGICKTYRGQTGEEVLEYTKYTVLGCSRDRCEDYREEMDAQMKSVQNLPYESLLAESAAVWEKKWENADVKIEGDRELQNGLRFSVYHLLRCYTGKEDRTQVCAKGFAGEAYYGRYFWDSEIYLLPFYLYTDPQAARSLLMYRYHTLTGAKENAARYHCRGARYPWQSGITGTEQCSLWEYADNEIHITADVAFAVMHYYLATDDREFLFDYGIEILLETARFWSDRVDRDESGVCHLLNVMGPDEYSPMTRDNGFTVRMVKYNLDAAVEMAEMMGCEAPEKYQAFVEKTGISREELCSFREISESLKVPYDSERDLYLQSADFEQYDAIDLDGLWADKNKAFGHFVSQEKIYRTRCIKQADTIALMSLFPDEFSDKQAETAYDYYTPYTTHDSSLSPAVHTLVANRIGREREVRGFVRRTLEVDLSAAKKGAEDGIHIANCAALWQMVVLGFLGMKPGYQAEELNLNPRLPEFVKHIETKVWWKGKQHKISAGPEPGEIRGFIFDLDGVLTDTAEYHYEAWLKLAEKLGLRFDRKMNERLKGVSRLRSFEIILEENDALGRFTEEETEALITEKNEIYKTLIRQITPADILPGIGEFLREAKKKGIKLAVASASKNAGTVLRSLKIDSMFDYIADASKITRAKPDPEVFNDCLKNLGLKPEECIGFEDAQAGVEAIKRAGMKAVGIGVEVTGIAPDLPLTSTRELSFEKIIKTM